MEGESGRKTELVHEGGHDFGVVFYDMLEFVSCKGMGWGELPNGTNAFLPLGTSGLSTGTLADGWTSSWFDMLLQSAMKVSR